MPKYRRPPTSAVPTELDYPDHVLVAMAPDESVDAMNAALARIGILLDRVTYLPLQSTEDLESPAVDRIMKTVKALHDRITLVVEPAEHYIRGMDGRWPVGTVTDEMYAWKAKTVRKALRTKLPRVGMTYKEVDSDR